MLQATSVDPFEVRSMQEIEEYRACNIWKTLLTMDDDNMYNVITVKTIPRSMVKWVSESGITSREILPV